MAIPATEPQWIELDGAVNARAVVPGALLRSDNLQSLTDSDVVHLVEAQSLEVVLDLRTEVELVLEGPGPLTEEPRVRIEHHSLYPVNRNKVELDADTIRPGTNPWGRSDRGEFLDETPAVRSYLGYIHSRPDSVVASIREIAHAEGAVLVHCAAGKDRTGTVVALALEASGVPREQIAADYLASAERIDAIIARLVSSETYRAELEGHNPQDHAPVPGTIERVLEVMEQLHGGTVAWLTENGLDESELTQLRSRLNPAPGE
jgi:protein-tyrosine phosphatase